MDGRATDTSSDRPRGGARRALTAAAVALLVAAPVTLVAGALFLRLHNAGERALLRQPADSFARQLARRIAAARSPAEAQAATAELARTVGDRLTLATVIAEPRSTKYRFLRKRRILSHSALPARVGRTLDRRAAADKVLYDLAATVRKRGPRSELLSGTAAGRPLRARAAVPVLQHGKHRATVIVVTSPRAPAGLPPAWPIGLLAGGLLLLGAAVGALSWRQRYRVILPGVLLLAAGQALLLGRAAEGVAAALGDSAERLRQLIGQAAPPPLVEVEGLWALVCAAALGVGLALAGWLGVGRRVAAALRAHRLAYSLLLPATVGMLLLVVIPFGYGLGLGFFNHAHGTYTFVGLDNFVEILAGDRPLSHPLNFYFTLGVTILWTGVNVLLHLSIGLGLALLLRDPLLRFKGLYRTLLILPWAVPNYITALIWKGMFHHQFGAVNQLLDLLGIDKVSWFSSFSTAFTANVVTNTWLGFPFMMVVSLGALQSIPGEVYEAAAVDGASRRQTFFSITLPLLRPALVPAIVLGSIWTFNMFNIIYLVSGGEPGGGSDILITEGYRWAFERADRYGLAAAYALLIFVILLTYTLVTRRLTRRAEEARG